MTPRGKIAHSKEKVIAACLMAIDHHKRILRKPSRYDFSACHKEEIKKATTLMQRAIMSLSTGIVLDLEEVELVESWAHSGYIIKPDIGELCAEV